METKHTTPTPQPVHPKEHLKAKTPLQQLIAQKRELKHRCNLEQQRVSEEWDYLKGHSGKLIVSTVSGLLFPHRKHTKKTEPKKDKPEFWKNVTDNLPYYLAVLREGLSIGWYITRPFYLRWLAAHRNKMSKAKR